MVAKLLEKIQQTFRGNSKVLTVNISELIKVTPTKKQEMPMLMFSAEAYTKMRTLVEGINTEVAWHGTVFRDGLHFMVTDIIVYPQLVTGTTVESDDAEYSKFLDTLPDETYNAIRLQGHSHVNMGVTPSSTDWSYYEELVAHVPDFYVTMITNKANAVWAEIYDITNNIVYETADIKLINATADDPFLAQAKLMLKTQTPKPLNAKTPRATIGGTPFNMDEYDSLYGRRNY